jgi:hypothetical protein
MALKKLTRRRCPLDGSWFRTTARLQSIMRAAAHYDDEMVWPKFVEDTIVPVWVRMEKYKAQETREHPDGMVYGPVIRVGTFESPELVMHGYHHAAGLYYDTRLDGLSAGVHEDKWIYDVIEGDAESPGEDVGVYRCDQCGEGLYRDDLGLRDNYSACLMDGELVCRDCDWTGLVATQEVRDRIERCLKLAHVIGPECRRDFESRLAHLSLKQSWGDRPTQTRLFNDCKWSFFFSERIKVDGEWKRGLCGGLIQHGPAPTLGDDGTWRFETYDYKEKRSRLATPEEIRSIRWSTHT